MELLKPEEITEPGMYFRPRYDDHVYVVLDGGILKCEGTTDRSQWGGQMYGPVGKPIALPDF